MLHPRVIHQAEVGDKHGGLVTNEGRNDSIGIPSRHYHGGLPLSKKGLEANGVEKGRVRVIDSNVRLLLGTTTCSPAQTLRDKSVDAWMRPIVLSYGRVQHGITVTLPVGALPISPILRIL